MHEHEGRQHDPALDIFLDLKDAKPLTEEDIAWGVDETVSRFENDYMRRGIRTAPDEQAALLFLREQGRWWGRYGSEGFATGHQKGVEVKRQGRGGVIPFAEIVRRVRGTASTGQLALF